MQETLWLPADWQAPSGIIAGTSLSNSPLCTQGFNLARHVQDQPERVERHRQKLARHSGLEAQRWLWLNQIHSNIVVSDENYQIDIDADAVISRSPDAVAVVMTADCLPILLCNAAGTEVAAIHAGWSGLYKDIIRNTIMQFHSPAQQCYAWIGPCATQARYEVDEAFYARFIEKNPDFVTYFRANREGHYLADLPAIARHQLSEQGIAAENISGGELCSIGDARFFSYRRDAGSAGRMASFIAPIKSPSKTGYDLIIQKTFQ